MSWAGPIPKIQVGGASFPPYSELFKVVHTLYMYMYIGIRLIGECVQIK